MLTQCITVAGKTQEVRHAGRRPPSHVTQRHRLAEGGDGLALGDKFLGEVAGVAGGDDSLADGGVLELLGVVDLVAAGTPPVW